MVWTAFVCVVFFLIGCNKAGEPAPIDIKDEPGEYRARVRESIQERIGMRGEPIKDRNDLVGDWDVAYDRWFEKLPPKLVFVYHMQADGTLSIETLLDGRRLQDSGWWKLNSDGTFTKLISCPPDPSIPGLENGAIDDSRYHLLGLADGRRVIWNGDGSLVLILSPQKSKANPHKDQASK
jgi:hypothetical protein